MRGRSNRRRGPVTPVELAEAAVLADLALGLVVLGWLLPLGSALFAAACVPLVVLGVRQRFRVTVIGVMAAAALGFLVGGTGVDTNLLICAAVSAMVAVGIRHEWGPTRASLTALVVLWPPIAAVTLGLLALFSSLRKLSLDQLRNFWNAIRHLLRRVGLPGAARVGDRVVRYGLRHWWLLVPAAELLAIAVASRVTYWLARRVVGRLAVGPPRVALGDGAADAREPGPVPVTFADVAFRYPGGATDAVSGLQAEVVASEFVAVTGPNGVGKSTFVRLLAGAEPSSGTVERPGAVGLGREGGTALVFQRPESQVLGVRVCDDVVWGLPVASHGAGIDVEEVLASVGLAGLGDRDTITLSGGQLQRLAIAAALARRPALLVSDESTAMLDPSGRARLLTLLRELPQGGGPTVVHATHRADEIDAADSVVALTPAAASAAPARPRAVPPPAAVRTHRYLASSGPLVTLRGVGYTYSAGTPWARRALRGVDLSLGRADAVLVVGGNGSGKTTLAWLLAGLLTPTEGEALLEERPIVAQVGRVGLGFQHARLQLLRRTVAGELDGLERGQGSAQEALRLVGLPPQLAARPIDDLSGGQQRRVALARLLMNESPLLVLDEPLAGLDDDARAELVAVLLRLRAQRPFGLVIVSHDLVELAPVVDRVVALRNGEVVLDQPSDPLGAVDAVSAFLAAEDV